MAGQRPLPDILAECAPMLSVEAGSPIPQLLSACEESLGVAPEGNVLERVNAVALSLGVRTTAVSALPPATAAPAPDAYAPGPVPVAASPAGPPQPKRQRLNDEGAVNDRQSQLREANQIVLKVKDAATTRVIEVKAKPNTTILKIVAALAEKRKLPVSGYTNTFRLLIEGNRLPAHNDTMTIGEYLQQIGWDIDDTSGEDGREVDLDEVHEQLGGSW